MIRPVAIEIAGRQLSLVELEVPLVPQRLIPGDGGWEVELGFGKGRYLLRRAQQNPERRFLGIELSASYWRLCCRRGRRRGLRNVVAICGEALYLLSAVLPSRFARAVHVYFPDPWPKSRHHKRRLFDPETVDLVLRPLAPGGRLYFATDHPEYGETVAEILERHPAVALERRSGPWTGGPRTNYEAKYMREGRPILRLEARIGHRCQQPRLHPAGEMGVLVGAGRGSGL
jgi:tRNA (guanine-N7-)-methyltransferase